MNPAFSLYLDALRAATAFVVLLSHWAYPRFTDGLYIALRHYNIGSDAVMVFFVLSGLVISHTARTKDTTPARFALARATRVLSVALPAVLLTFVLDKIGSTANPTAYNGWWYAGNDYAARIVAALTFTSQNWFADMRLGSNGPYWSLCYEVWYYVLFAIAFFGRTRARWLAVALLLAALGPRIALLMPAWLMGVAAERTLNKIQKTPMPYARLMAIAPPLLYIALQAMGTPHALAALTQHLLGGNTVALLAFSDEFLWNNLIAALAAVHLVGMAQLQPQLRAQAFVKWAAGGSFTLYLLHYPLMQCVDALLPEATALWRHAALLMLTLAGCVAVAAVTERKLPQLRALLNHRA